MERYFGEAVPKLGFGLMRLPKEASGKIDIEQTKKMVELFMSAGLNYFDTAYVYDSGDSEKAAKEALADILKLIDGSATASYYYGSLKPQD